MANQARPAQAGGPDQPDRKIFAANFSVILMGWHEQRNWLRFGLVVVTAGFEHAAAPDSFARTTSCRTGREAARPVRTRPFACPKSRI